MVTNQILGNQNNFNLSVRLCLYGNTDIAMFQPKRVHLPKSLNSVRYSHTIINNNKTTISNNHNTHRNVPVRQQQVHDYVRSEKLYTVQAFLDVAQLLTQGLPTEPLPRHTNLMPDGLPEVLTVNTRRNQRIQFFHNLVTTNVKSTMEEAVFTSCTCK